MAGNIESQTEALIEKFQNTVFMVQSLGRIGAHLGVSFDLLDFVNLVEYFGELQAQQFDELRVHLNQGGV